VPDLICDGVQAAGFDYVVTDGMLARASSRIRTYTRQHVTVGESTALLPGPGPWLLPQRPVRAVTSVVDRDGQPVDYRLDGQLLHAPAEGVTATFAHGFDPVPDGLLELCAQIADRLSTQPKELTEGVQQETVGGITRGFGSWAAGGVAELTPAERTVIDRFYPRRPRTVQLAP
jgi:hypothetical protein